MVKHERGNYNLEKDNNLMCLVKETHAHVLIGLLGLLFLLDGGSGSTRLTSSGSGASRSSGASSAKGEKKLLEVLALNSLGENVGPDLNHGC